MKEIKKPYNVYLVIKENGDEELKFIQGIYDEPYKRYLGLYVLTDDEVRFPLLDFNTGQISLNENLKKIDDRIRAIENLENYYKENPEENLSSPIISNTNLFFKINEDTYIFDFDLQDQINIIGQIAIEKNTIQFSGYKNEGLKENFKFSLSEAKLLYDTLYNNLKGKENGN